MPVIRFEGASVSYEGTVVLHPTTLELTEHRIGIIGSNGSGKSTLVRLINGLITPSTGTVYVDALNPVTDGKLVRRRVGFVF